jgi:hypothetical protein
VVVEHCPRFFPKVFIATWPRTPAFTEFDGRLLEIRERLALYIYTMRSGRRPAPADSAVRSWGRISGFLALRSGLSRLCFYDALWLLRWNDSRHSERA